jgi:hypothetical protein
MASNQVVSLEISMDSYEICRLAQWNRLQWDENIGVAMKKGGNIPWKHPITMGLLWDYYGLLSKSPKCQ